ncbi:nitrilase-related carbon-nitrogen hydrolase, partial [Bacillus thuringiensis]
MGSSGSMVKPISGFLTALIQYPVPVVESRADIDKQIQQIIKTIHSTKSGYPGLELIVFPEYSTQGLNTKKWTTEEFLCTVPGPETDLFAEACKESKVYGVFSIMEKNPGGGEPYNTAVIIDPQGEMILKYRKLNPWVPVEPWKAGDLGLPVCVGPGG